MSTFAKRFCTGPSYFARANLPSMDDARGVCARGPWLLAAAWLTMGVLALLIPFFQWRNRKNEYYTAYGYAIEYEQQQRAYEEAQRGDNNNGQNWYYPTCKWYDYACRKAAYRYRQGNANNNGQNNQNDDRDMNNVPNWYLFLGGQTEEGRREMEEQGNMSNTASLNFVHVWTIVMFVAILAYGAVVLMRYQSSMGGTASLMFVLAFFLQFLLVNVLLLAQGVIQTDGRAMENSIYGWFGQTSILMVYTDFWLLLFSAVFIVVLALRMLWQWRQERRLRRELAQKEADLNSYVHIDAPLSQQTSNSVANHDVNATTERTEAKIV